ncbi:MAG: hypothetical protein ACRDL0_08895 [Thermoleophilaceae bacterium]
MKRTDRRSDMPAKLVGAAHFDRNADAFAPAALIRIAKQSRFLDELRQALDFSRADTVRKREPGDWALAFLAFASSPIPDLRPWGRDSSTDLWWEAGFKQRPSYDLLYKRFVELQERGGIEAFFEASAKLIRLAIVATHGLVCRDMTRITDSTAGCRTKEGSRGGVSSWIGHSDMKLDCMTVGLSAVRVIESCSVQEYDIYPAAYKKLKYILDGVPRSVVGDKGLSIKRIFQMHSDDGVFSIIPFRGGQQEPVPVDRERWDRYGRPRCENCGGVTRFKSFTKGPPARVFFECSRKPFPECDGRQQLRCSEDPRFILPLWRGTALYEALEDSGMEYERTHRLTRQRHASGGNNFATRPKRKGRDWQQLIANASIVSDWLKLAWRNGWLPGTRTHASLDVTRLDAAPKKDAFDAKYANKGLNSPYGERAAAFKLGPWRVEQYYRAELKDAPPRPHPSDPSAARGAARSPRSRLRPTTGSRRHASGSSWRRLDGRTERRAPRHCRPAPIAARCLACRPLKSASASALAAPGRAATHLTRRPRRSPPKPS